MATGNMYRKCREFWTCYYRVMLYASTECAVVVCVSVCLSVCLSQASTVQKWLNIGLQCHTIAQFSIFCIAFHVFVMGRDRDFKFGR